MGCSQVNCQRDAEVKGFVEIVGLGFLDTPRDALSRQSPVAPFAEPYSEFFADGPNRASSIGLIVAVQIA
jgi:hypothetical protein